MKQLFLKDIQEIKRNPQGKGYLIIFNDGQTIPALLTLIKYGEGCESDLTTASNNLQ